MTTSITVPDIMHAWTQHRYGDASRLSSTEVAVPSLAEDEVLVQVASTSINAADKYMSDPALALRPLLGGLRGPKRSIGGLDVAGTVVALGASVDGFAVGDRVFGDVGGGFGAYCAARADRLAHVPASMSLLAAGGVPVAALTALQGLRDHAGVQPGARVLVNGASGGVGTFAVQIAAALGAEVTAVCSTSNVDAARELGATTVLDYTGVDVIDHFVSNEERFDAVFDVAGVHSVRQRSTLLAPGGCCLFVGAPSGGRVFGPLLAFAGSMIAAKFTPGRFVGFTAKSDGDDMAAIADMIERGQVRTVVEEVVSFGRLPDAMARFARGHLSGKVVIEH